tara:strand:+ start:27077 stop:27928 length:852 start_codon:yes stop_codon:yes gene_type:complete
MTFFETIEYQDVLAGRKLPHLFLEELKLGIAPGLVIKNVFDSSEIAEIQRNVFQLKFPGRLGRVKSFLFSRVRSRYWNRVLPSKMNFGSSIGRFKDLSADYFLTTKYWDTYWAESALGSLYPEARLCSLVESVYSTTSSRCYEPQLGLHSGGIFRLYLERGESPHVDSLDRDKFQAALGHMNARNTSSLIDLDNQMSMLLSCSEDMSETHIFYKKWDRNYKEVKKISEIPASIKRIKLRLKLGDCLLFSTSNLHAMEPNSFDPVLRFSFFLAFRSNGSIKYWS